MNRYMAVGEQRFAGGRHHAFDKLAPFASQVIDTTAGARNNGFQLDQVYDLCPEIFVSFRNF